MKGIVQTVFLRGLLLVFVCSTMACQKEAEKEAVIKPDEKISPPAYVFRRSSGCVNPTVKLITVSARKGFNVERRNSDCVDLRPWDLREAKLANANLRGANFEKRNLEKADLQGADLRGARLADVDLTVAKSLEGARFSIDTQMSLSREQAEALGMIFVDERQLDAKLFQAQVDGDLQTAIAALQDGADPWTLTDGSSNAMEEAIRNGRVEMVRAMVSYGHDLERTSPAVIVAAESNNPVMLASVLEFGGDANAKSGEALKVAVARNSTEMVESLLKSGLKIPAAACGEDGACLIASFRNKHFELFQILLSHITDANQLGLMGRTPLEIILHETEGRLSPYADALLTSGASVDLGPACSTYLAMVRDVALAEKLFALKAPVSPPNSQCGEHAFIELLKGLKIARAQGLHMADDEVTNLLQVFIRHGSGSAMSQKGEPAALTLLDDPRLFALAVKAGLDWKTKTRAGENIWSILFAQNQSRLTPQMVLDVVEFLNARETVNWVESVGGDPLFLRALRLFIRHSDLSERLVQILSSATFSAKYSEKGTGRSALQVLLKDNQNAPLPKGVVQLLKDKGDDVNQISSSGELALAQCDYVSCITDLMSAGADPKYVNAQNENLFFVRLRSRRNLERDIYSEYVRHGVDPAQKNAQGQSLLDVALLMGVSSEVVEQLRPLDPNHVLFTAKYFRCEDDKQVISAHLPHSDLIFGKLKGEALKIAPKSQMTDITQPRDPISSELKRDGYTYQLEIKTRDYQSLKMSTRNFTTWEASWGGSAMTCQPATTDPLPSTKFVNLFFECVRDSADVGWVRLNEVANNSGGTVFVEGDRYSLSAYNATALSKTHHVYRVFQSGINAQYLYFNIEELKNVKDGDPFLIRYYYYPVSRIDFTYQIDCRARLAP